MMQFYFLSILMNLICALFLFYKSDRNSKLKDVKILENPVIILVTGCLTFVTALVKLFLVCYGEKGGIIILGDFIPAVSGLTGGACLLLQYYKMNSSVELKLPEGVKKVFLDNNFIIAIVCAVSAVLHFFLAKVIFF